QWSCKSEPRCGGGAGRIYEFVRRAEGQDRRRAANEANQIKLNRPGTAWGDDQDDDRDDDEDEDEDEDEDDNDANDHDDLNTNEMTATAIELTMKKRQWYRHGGQLRNTGGKVRDLEMMKKTTTFWVSIFFFQTLFLGRPGDCMLTDGLPLPRRYAVVAGPGPATGEEATRAGEDEPH
ncbi:hypothetical protein K466DRAFT_571350, partial [Polyporus arcularius HHB13444]